MGKSFTAFTILASIAFWNNKASIIIADYKNSFKQFHGLNNFYGYTQAVEGIKTFYNELQSRIASNGSEEQEFTVCYLFVDELSSLIQAQATTKEKNDILTMISTILSMGREYNMRILVGLQRRRFYQLLKWFKG